MSPPTYVPPTFAEVYPVVAPLVWRVLRRLAPEEAEDLAQEVLVVIHRKLATFEGRAKLTTWAYGICLRVASDHRRSARVRRQVTTPAPPEQVVAPQQAEAVARAQALARLDRALAQLDEDKRAVFVLYEIEELPMAEVAEVVGVPLQTAYARLHAARRRLAEVLAT